MTENLTRMEQLKIQEEELKKEVHEAKKGIETMRVYEVLDNRHKLLIHDIEYELLNKEMPEIDDEFFDEPYITLRLIFEDNSKMNLNVSLKNAFIN